MAYKWTRIDELSLRDFLSEDDECYRYYDYTPGAGYKHSLGNDKISNLHKNPLEIAGREDLTNHKKRVISEFAADVISFLEPLASAADSVLIVPVPSSKSEDNPAYDNRIQQVAGIVANKLGFHLCDSLKIINERQPLHAGGVRSPDAIAKNYSYEKSKRCFELIIIIDDVLTKGTNFCAVKQTMGSFHPGIKIIGLFWALVEFPG